jgi:hypothetical protein
MMHTFFLPFKKWRVCRVSYMMHTFFLPLKKRFGERERERERHLSKQLKSYERVGD